MAEYWHTLSLFNSRWEEAGLLDPNEFADCAEFVNQREGYLDCYEGEWLYPDPEKLRIYCGSFGNDNSPFCSEYTHCVEYDTPEEFATALARWEAYLEYIEMEEEEEEEEYCE